MFCVVLAKEAVLTQDNLMKRGIPLCSICLFCGKTVETINHLFLHCRVTSQLRRLFLNLKEMSWVMPSKITEAIQSWEEAGMQSKSRERWRIVFLLSFGGKYGRRGILDVLIVQKTACKKSSLIACCYYVFGVLYYTQMTLFP